MRIDVPGSAVAGRRWMAVLAVVTLVFAASGSAEAYQRPGRTERVSVGSDGRQLGQDSSGSAISGDGRYLAFSTNDLGVVQGDSNGTFDIFVRDRSQGGLERIPVAADGTEGNSDSYQPDLSGDGRYVAFFSWASNLVPGDTNDKGDTFVHDRVTGEIERVSVTSDGTQGNGESWGGPDITPDGRHVAFRSWASNLAPDDTNANFDVFVHDRQTGQTDRVSVATDGTGANGFTGDFRISDDGRYVVFESTATNLVPGDVNLQPDVFLRDRQAGTTERVSVTASGSEANAGSGGAAISGDGRYVAFESYASNLVPVDGNAVRDIFVRDLETGSVERVSLTSNGAEAGGASGDPAMSSDGRYVAFESYASNLVPGDGSSTADIFLRDRMAGSTERVSVAFDGSSPNRSSSEPNLDASGRWVTFRSGAGNLTSGDTNSVHDVFVRDRGPALGVGGLQASGGGDPTVSGWASFAGTVLTSAADARDDAGPGAEQAGAELTAATLTHRPEQEDLLVRLNLAGLPMPGAGAAGVVTQSGVGGGPAILYGMEFQAGGVRYEVRVMRAAATANLPRGIILPAVEAPYFALFRCDSTCAEVARLSGGFGTIGDEIVVSVPLSTLGAGDIPITGVRAFAAVGEASPGTVDMLDEVSLPDATLRPPAVTLGIAPAGTSEDQVVFNTEAELAGGAFSGALDTATLPPGEYDVWARACLGETCGAARTPVG